MKLSKKLDEALAHETPQSLTNWLIMKRANNMDKHIVYSESISDISSEKVNSATTISALMPNSVMAGTADSKKYDNAQENSHAA